MERFMNRVSFLRQSANFFSETLRFRGGRRAERRRRLIVPAAREAVRSMDPNLERLEERVLLSYAAASVNFEGISDASQFAASYNAPTISRVSGNGGHVLSLMKNNAVGSAKFSPGGVDYVYGNGIITADADLNYYNTDSHDDAIVLKTFTDSASQSGAYVVNLYNSNGAIKLSIGASTVNGLSSSFYTSAQGHTTAATYTLGAYTVVSDSTLHDLGYYHLSVATTTPASGQYQIAATVTAPDGTVYATKTWTDTGSAAVTANGITGLSVYDQWNDPSYFDNYTITPQDTGPVLAISGNSSASINNPYTLSLASSEVGANVISQWTIDWGDGSSPEVVSGNPSSVQYTYGAAGNHTISATATDQSGTYSAPSTVAVGVTAPVIALSGSATIGDATAYQLTLGSVSNLPPHSISSYIVHWGDGNSNTYGSAGAVTHTYAAAGSDAITVDLVDSASITYASAGTLSLSVSPLLSHSS
jgi:hypothetical protein